MALSSACAVALGYNGFFARTTNSFVANDNTACYRLRENECGNNNAWGYVVGPNVEGTERVVEFYVQTSKAPSSLATALFKSTERAAFQVMTTRFDDSTRVVTATMLVYQCGRDSVLDNLGVPANTGFEQVGTDSMSNVDREYGLILVLVMLSAVVLMFTACVVTRRTYITLPQWCPSKHAYRA